MLCLIRKLLKLLIMKNFLKNIFRLTTAEELEKKVKSFSYEDVNNILRWNKKLVNHIYSYNVTESDEDNASWTTTKYYTLLDIADEHMKRLLRHWGGKTFSELEEEKEVLRRKEEEVAQKEKLAAENRKKNGKEIVDRLLGC